VLGTSVGQYGSRRIIQVEQSVGDDWAHAIAFGKREQNISRTTKVLDFFESLRSIRRRHGSKGSRSNVRKFAAKES
jgi:hypothetical protein